MLRMDNCLIYSVGDQREQEVHVPNVIIMVYCLLPWLTNFFGSRLHNRFPVIEILDTGGCEFFPFRFTTYYFI